MNSSERLMDIAERLTELDPVRTYASRGATLLAGLVGAHAFRLDRPEVEPLRSESLLTNTEPTISLPCAREGLRSARCISRWLAMRPPGANSSW